MARSLRPYNSMEYSVMTYRSYANGAAPEYCKRLWRLRADVHDGWTSRRCSTCTAPTTPLAPATPCMLGRRSGHDLHRWRDSRSGRGQPHLHDDLGRWRHRHLRPLGLSLPTCAIDLTPREPLDLLRRAAALTSEAADDGMPRQRVQRAAVPRRPALADRERDRRRRARFHHRQCRWQRPARGPGRRPLLRPRRCGHASRRVGAGLSRQRRRCRPARRWPSDADRLVGNAGFDVFVYGNRHGSLPSRSDTILPGDNVAFEGVGDADGDLLDLSNLDANVILAGSQAFSFGTDRVPAVSGQVMPATGP